MSERGSFDALTTPPGGRIEDAEHQKMVDKALFIRDPDVRSDVRYAFSKLAARILGVAENEVAERWTLLPGESVKINAGETLDLLAVVNRPDLALPILPEASDSKLSGAEVRFEYAVNAGSVFTQKAVILEIVVKAMNKSEFQAYLGSWKALQGSSNFANDLNGLLEAKVFQPGWLESARIRMVANKADVWHLRQYAFQGDHINPATLDREFPLQAKALGDDAASYCLRTWLEAPRNAHAVLSGSYNFSAACKPDDQLLRLPTYESMILQNFKQEPLPLEKHIPASHEGQPIDRSLVKKLVSLNACSRCHSQIHATRFLHAKPETESPTSDTIKANGGVLLSDFLTGATTQNELASLIVTTNRATGRHNDLLRRHYYMRKVAELNATATNWREELKGLIVNQVH